MMNLLKNKFRTRVATIRDCQLIYHWRNDVLIRRFSTSPDRLNYDNHVRWFEENYKQFIIGEVDRKSVGVVHSKVSGDVVEVSIYLKPSLIGRRTGVALLLLQEFYNRVVNYLPSTTKLVANIHRNNVASIKLFEKAGYKDSEFITMEKIVDVDFS